MKINVNNFPLRISGKCTSCEKDFFFNEDKMSINELNEISTDCPHCSTLLLIRENKVWSFHHKLHDENPKWPKNGEGTSYLEYEQ